MNSTGITLAIIFVIIMIFSLINITVDSSMSKEEKTKKVFKKFIMYMIAILILYFVGKNFGEDASWATFILFPVIFFYFFFLNNYFYVA